MTDVEALVAFLVAQLDEDERVDRAAESKFFYSDGHDAEWYVHFERFDHQRLRREVEGKRQILARYEDAVARTSDLEHSTAVAELQVREYEDYVIPALVLGYAARPGFDPSWLTADSVGPES